MEHTEKNPAWKNNSFDLAVYIVRHFKFLMVITLVAAVAGGVASFLLSPKFKSMVVLFPSSTTPISQVLLNNSPYFNVGNLQGFGEEKEAEQMLQVLNSNAIKDRIIQKYNLMVHYAVDSDSKYKKSELYGDFMSNVSFKKNEYNAVEITVFDTDPLFASNMANDIAGMIDTLMNQMRKDRAKQAYDLVEKEYDACQASARSMEDSLSRLRKMGIQDYASTVDRLMQGYSSALVNNNANAAEKIQKQMQSVSPYASLYVSLSQRLMSSYQQLGNLKNRLMAMQVELDQFMPVKYIVDQAFPADKKSYPIRSLIIIVSGLSAFLIALFALIISDYWKKVKSQID